MRLVSTIINGYNDMEDQNYFWGDFHTLLRVKVYFRITFAKILSGMTDYKKCLELKFEKWAQLVSTIIWEKLFKAIICEICKKLSGAINCEQVDDLLPRCLLQQIEAESTSETLSASTFCKPGTGTLKKLPEKTNDMSRATICRI